MRRPKNNRGVTLVEAVVAIVVLGIAIPPLTVLFTEVAAHTPDDIYQRVALGYADALLEEVVSKAFEDPDLPSGSFGAEETGRVYFDDIDDFDGWSQSPPQRMDGTPLDEYGGFSRSVIIDNVSAANPDPAVALADGSTDFKRIRVRVEWTNAKGGEVTLATLRTALADTTGTPPTGVLDDAASAASASRRGGREFQLDLVSISSTDLTIESFSLSADVTTERVERMRLANNQIWKVGGGVSLPTGTLALNDGSAADRTVSAGASPQLRIRFRNDPSGTINYTLVLFFTDGSSSTLSFPIVW